MRTEDVMNITFIRLFVNVFKYALYCLLKIGALNCPVKEILYFTYLRPSTKACCCILDSF